MRIGIDLQPLKKDPSRGISISTKCLVDALLKSDAGSRNTYILFNAKGTDPSFFKRFRGRKIEIVKGDITPKLSMGLDVFHFTSFFDMTKKQISPNGLKCRTIATVYDLIPALFWDHYLTGQPEKVRKDYISRMGEIEKFDRIIAPSLSTKKDVAEILNISKERIDVVELGVSEIFGSKVSANLIDGIRKDHGIKKDYLLCIGARDGRKNLVGLVKSYFMLDEKIRKDCQLVIAGEMDSDYIEHLLRFYPASIKERVVFTGTITEKEIVALYRNASLFVFPSFYEGFGLPVLEAMKCGCPVITSDVSSLPEIAGDAAILIDPYDEKSISKAITRIISDKPLAEKMRKKGIKQASKFKWDGSAEKVLEAYEKTAADNLKEGRSARTDNLQDKRQKLRLGVVSGWNSRDGLATYTSLLLKGLSKDIQTVIFAKDSNEMIKKDKGNVIRCWDWGDNLERLDTEIRNERPDIVHFQFNFGYFRLDSLAGLVKKLRQMGIRSIITFHSTNDAESSIKLRDIKEGLGQFDRIFVHTRKGLRRMRALGLCNAEILPHGNEFFADRKREEVRKNLFSNNKVISAFGFPFPHKATMEVIKALSIVKKRYPDILFIDLCSLNPDSTAVDIIKAYHEKCKRSAFKLGLSKNVIFFTDYLHELEVIELLQASDMIVMPYKPIKDSASGAIRYALASHRPVITTDTNIFSEFDKEVYKIKDHSPKNIAKAIIRLFEDKKMYGEIVENAERYAEENRWENITKRYEAVLRSLA